MAPGTSDVLVVVDAQRAYLDPGVSPLFSVHGAAPRSRGDARSVCAHLADLVAAARATGVPVVWTRLAEHPDEVCAALAAKLLTDEPRFSFTCHDPRHGPAAGLDRLPHEVVVDKTHLDGFAHTTLADTLASFGARRVVLAGAYAGRCVLATALGATCNGFGVEVVTDSVMYHPAVPGELDVLSALVTSSLGTVVGRAEVARRWQRRSR